MPASYEATVFRPKGDPILNLKNVRGMSRDEQKTLLSHLNGTSTTSTCGPRGQHAISPRASRATSWPTTCR
jgi:hypothetical protein